MAPLATTGGGSREASTARLGSGRAVVGSWTATFGVFIVEQPASRTAASTAIRATRVWNGFMAARDQSWVRRPSIWSLVWIALELISYARWGWIIATSSSTTLTFEVST